MGKTMDAGRAVKEFCNTCFMLRKPELAAEFWTVDVALQGQETGNMRVETEGGGLFL